MRGGWSVMSMTPTMAIGHGDDVGSAAWLHLDFPRFVFRISPGKVTTCPDCKEIVWVINCLASENSHESGSTTPVAVDKKISNYLWISILCCIEKFQRAETNTCPIVV